MLKIRVTSKGKQIGILGCDEFRQFMNDQTSFLAVLVKRFNDGKAKCGEPERVEEVIQH